MVPGGVGYVCELGEVIWAKAAELPMTAAARAQVATNFLFMSLSIIGFLVRRFSGATPSDLAPTGSHTKAAMGLSQHGCSSLCVSTSPSVDFGCSEPLGGRDGTL